MGKDVIIILIIILSYKILMRYSREIEGVNGSDAVEDESTGTFTFKNLKDNWKSFVDRLSDSTIPYVCDMTDKEYDSINHRCVTFNPRDRPNKCKDTGGSEANCIHTYFDVSKSCDSITDATDCINNVGCIYNNSNNKCSDRKDLCKFNEDVCINQNFSVDLDDIAALLHLYEANMNEVPALEIFLTENKYVSDLEITEIPDLIDFYNSVGDAEVKTNLQNVVSFIVLSSPEIQDRVNNYGNGLTDVISNAFASTSGSAAVVDLDTLIANLFNGLKLATNTPVANTGGTGEQVPDDSQEDYLEPGNQEIRLNVLNIILHLQRW